MYDVVVIGGGVAGLSAALVLGRSCRRVLVCDTKSPPGASLHAVRGFLGRDGADPQELRRQGREELGRYETVEVRLVAARDVCREGAVFRVTLEDGHRCLARKVVVATGVAEELPPVEGIDALYGGSVFSSPARDGWEVRGQALAAYGRGPDGLHLALELTGWSRDVVLCTDGPAGLSEPALRRLACHGVTLREQKVLRLEGRDGQLEQVLFRDGGSLPRRALFFAAAWRQRSGLAVRLGCRLDEDGLVAARRDGSTNIPGVFVAGDAWAGAQLPIAAAADGARVAAHVSKELLKEDLGLREGSRRIRGLPAELVAPPAWAGVVAGGGGESSVGAT